MRRLDPEEAAAALARAEPIPEGRPRGRRVRTRLLGRDPSGDDAHVELRGPTLVLFCATTCDGCAELAALAAEGIDGVDVLGVLRPPAGPLPDDGIASFTRRGGRWLVGDDAFGALDVRAAPFFCVVGADGAVVVEGVALGRAHVADHVARALAGRPRPDAVRLAPPR